MSIRTTVASRTSQCTSPVWKVLWLSFVLAALLALAAPKVDESRSLTVAVAVTPLAFDAIAAEHGKLSPSYLRTEYRVNPLGIDVAKPQLSWIVESAERRQKQSAYQVLVATSQQKLDAGEGDLWDSGRYGATKRPRSRTPENLSPRGYSAIGKCEFGVNREKQPAGASRPIASRPAWRGV